jgi:hypothetical protein
VDISPLRRAPFFCAGADFAADFAAGFRIIVSFFAAGLFFAGIFSAARPFFAAGAFLAGAFLAGFAEGFFFVELAIV